MENSVAVEELESKPTEAVVAETASPVKPKQQVNPIIALVIIVVVLGGVYVAYMYGTREHVTHIRKGNAAPPHNQ